eukprot:5291841-Heterocapsa_arctica.AAC.1
MREVELSSVRLSSVVFSHVGVGGCCGRCTILLPVSKTDHKALGQFREHGCCCPDLSCPVAAAKRLQLDAI